MKKFVFPVILGFLLLWPLRLESKRLLAKMTFGLSSGGNITDAWHLNPEFYDFTLSQGEKPNPGTDLALELIYQLHPNIGLSLGTGYISRRLNGSAGFFIPQGQNEPVENFSLTPELISDITPIYLSAMLTFPFKPSFRVNFQGGIGYYLGSIRSGEIEENYAADINPAMIANRLLWKFESKAKAIGFHAGAGVDIALYENIFFFIEALYRTASFKELKTSLQGITNAGLAAGVGQTGENIGEDSTFFYAQKVLKVEKEKDMDYRIFRYDFSGFSFRVGVKIGF